MRVPARWLRELVPHSFPVDDIAHRLTMAGFEVEEIIDVDGETVMETHVNANRGDALSMVGIAREVAALTGHHVAHPEVILPVNGQEVDTLATISVEASDLCPRYVARVILGVTIAPSPAWVQHRLLACGVRPINNIVDATNYVMLELGQPLHAFDLDALAEQTIIVRRAHDGELFTTLDGIERTLTSNMLVIADAQRPVALAGIMGGENSEVTAGTHNILLESAHFERTSVRKTARANTLSTESSYRFERIVDPAGVVRAADRAMQLMQEWAGGVVATGVIDVAEPLVLQRVITMPIARVNAVLGTNIGQHDIVTILRGLELEVRIDNDLLHVTVPSFRPDLLEEMDLIEEVARIYGYQHIPATVPGRVTWAGRQAPEMDFEDRVREILSAAGLFENISYTIFDYRILDQMQLPDDAKERIQIVAMRNPKSEEFTHLRPTLLISLLEYLRDNARRSIEDVQIFELGRIFRNTGGGLRFNYAREDRDIAQNVRVQEADKLPLEQRTAGIAIMGRPWTSRWNGGDSEVDFFWLKGLLEQFFADLGVGKVQYIPGEHPTLHPGRTAIVQVGDVMIGLLGEVHPKVAENFDLPKRAYLAEINVDALMSLIDSERVVPTIARFPAVWRDIALLVQTTQHADAIQQLIVKAGGKFLETVALFDVYQGATIPIGWRSLAYRLTFRAADRTLADDEVDVAMASIRKALVEKAGATLR